MNEEEIVLELKDLINKIYFENNLDEDILSSYYSVILRFVGLSVNKVFKQDKLNYMLDFNLSIEERNNLDIDLKEFTSCISLNERKDWKEKFLSKFKTKTPEIIKIICGTISYAFYFSHYIKTNLSKNTLINVNIDALKIIVNSILKKYDISNEELEEINKQYTDNNYQFYELFDAYKKLSKKLNIPVKFIYGDSMCGQDIPDWHEKFLFKEKQA